MPILLALQTAFSIWMLVDAVRRRAPEYWWLIVLVPFGEWVYFFAVKLPDTRFHTVVGRQLATRRVSLAQLRANYAETASHQNRVLLAQKLHDSGQHGEAAELFEQVLRNDEDDKDSLHGYALCCLRSDRRDMAVRALERLVDMDITYRDYTACEDLAALYVDGDDASAGRRRAIALLERACKKCQRIGPRRMLAQHLIADGREREARPLLVDGLRAYEGSPRYVKRRDRRDARQARSLLRSLA